jgi:hypothetical protein
MPVLLMGIQLVEKVAIAMDIKPCGTPATAIKFGKHASAGCE